MGRCPWIHGQNYVHKSLVDICQILLFVHVYGEKACLGQRERGDDLQMNAVFVIRLHRVGGKKAAKFLGTAVILKVLGKRMTDKIICNYFNSYFCDTGLHLPFALYLICKSCVCEDISTTKHFDTLHFLHLEQQHYLKQTCCLAKEGDTTSASQACSFSARDPKV